MGFDAGWRRKTAGMSLLGGLSDNREYQIRDLTFAQNCHGALPHLTFRASAAFGADVEKFQAMAKVVVHLILDAVFRHL
jgi:hypothetical protein